MKVRRIACQASICYHSHHFSQAALAKHPGSPNLHAILSCNSPPSASFHLSKLTLGTPISVQFNSQISRNKYIRQTQSKRLWLSQRLWSHLHPPRRAKWVADAAPKKKQRTISLLLKLLVKEAERELKLQLMIKSKFKSLLMMRIRVGTI